MDDATAFELNALDAVDTMDETATGTEGCLPLLRTPNFVPWHYSAWVIHYDSGKVKDGPKASVISGTRNTRA